MMKYGERMRLLTELFVRVRQTTPSRVFGVETVIVKTVNEMKEAHNEYVKEGYEGIMIRDPCGVYEPNKRSKYLQKYKEFMEDEFVITGFHDGEGIDKDAVIWNCVTKEGRMFSVKPKSTFEERKRIFKEADTYIGKLLTVVFQEYSPDGIPRFPVGKAIRDADC
jgi:DNA ligase-1